MNSKLPVSKLAQREDATNENSWGSHIPGREGIDGIINIGNEITQDSSKTWRLKLLAQVLNSSWV